MSGYYPDGVSQSDIDRALDGSEPHIGNTLEEDFDKLEAQVEKTCSLIDTLRIEKQKLSEALRECLSHYCPGCGFGDHGCATIHYIKCSYLALLEKAEGRELKLNMEPANEEVPF